MTGTFIAIGIGSLLLTILCDFWYRKKLSAGKRLYLLDFLAGLFFMGCVASGYCLYELFTGNNIFNDVFEKIYLPKSDFHILLVFSLYIIAMSYIWRLLIRFVFRAGANYMLIITTTLLFLLMTLYAVGNYIDCSHNLWGILGFFVLPFVALMCYFLIVVRFINFYRCPRCHAAGKRNIKMADSHDLGYHTEYSTDYKHDIDHDSNSWPGSLTETTTYTTKRYSVAKTKHDFEHLLICTRCNESWDIHVSFTTHTDKNLESVEKEVEERTYR